MTTAGTLNSGSRDEVTRTPAHVPKVADRSGEDMRKFKAKLAVRSKRNHPVGRRAAIGPPFGAGKLPARRLRTRFGGNQGPAVRVVKPVRRSGSSGAERRRAELEPRQARSVHRAGGAGPGSRASCQIVTIVEVAHPGLYKMKHPFSREPHAYWNACRGTREMPARGEVEPGALRRCSATLSCWQGRTPLPARRHQALRTVWQGTPRTGVFIHLGCRERRACERDRSHHSRGGCRRCRRSGRHCGRRASLQPRNAIAAAGT